MLDAADLLVLGTTVLMMVIFRQIDRTNRSIEKVKRYADKVKGDLDKIFDAKTDEIKDRTITLEVQEDTEREILKRIQEAEEEIRNRGESIDQFFQRMRTHEAQLEELRQMSAKVEESAGHVKDQAVHIDFAGKRVTKFLGKVSLLERNLSEIKNEFSRSNRRAVGEMKKEILARLSNTLTRVEEGLRRSEGRLERFNEKVDELAKKHETLAATNLEGYSQSLNQLEKAYRDRIGKAVERATRFEEDLFGTLRQDLEERFTYAQKQWSDKIASATARTEAVETDSEHQLASAKKRWELWEEESKERLERLSSKIKEREDSLNEVQANAHQDIRDQTSNLRQEVEDLRQLLSREMDEARSHIVDLSRQGNVRAEALVKEGIQSVEKRMEAHEETVEAKTQKFLLQTNQIDRLDQDLRTAMKEKTKELQQELGLLEETWRAERGEVQGRMEERIKATQTSLSALEGDLGALKRTAYENLAKELQQAEKTFLATIQGRNEDTERKLEEWMGGVEKRMEAIDEKSSYEGDKITVKVQKEWNTRLAEWRTNHLPLLTQLQEKENALHSQIEERMGRVERESRTHEKEMEKTFSHAKERVQAEGTRLFGDLEARVKQEAALVREAIEKETAQGASQLKDFQKELAERMETTKEQCNLSSRALFEKIERSRLAMEKSERNLQNESKEQERKATARYEIFKTELLEGISSMKKAFSDHKKTWDLAVNEREMELKSGLEALTDQVGKLHTLIEQKADQSLEQFRSDSDRFMIAFQKRLRGAQGESDLKIRTLQQGLADTQDKVTTMRKKVYIKVEEEAGSLSEKIDAIGKKQQEFLAHTQMFDRAEMLKESLRSDIDFLTVQMSSLETYKEDVTQLRSEISRIQKESERIESSVARVTKGKNRIEALEKKITQLGTLSETVDLNVTRLSSVNETIQKHQNRMRQLEDMQKNIELWYERLSKKSQLIDAASEGIEQNLTILKVTEDKVEDLRGETSRWEEALREVKREGQLLMKKKKEIDKAVRSTQELDGILKETAERMVQLERSRGWIAETEARIDKLGREALEQVRLLGALSGQRQGAKNRPDGPPSRDTREMVLRLAHEGWKSEEIARTMRISQGEVALILELSPRENN